MFKFKKFVLLLAITLLLMPHVMAEDIRPHNFPSFQDGILKIPRVDTPEQSGNFQDVKFQFTEQGTWELLDVDTYPLGQGIEIESVEAIVTDSIPVQVFLKIRIIRSSGCDFGQINQRLINGTVSQGQFEVTVYSNSLLSAPDITCAAQVVDPERTIPLSVFGLGAGTYEYSVNGGNIGTFTLTEDNTL